MNYAETLKRVDPSKALNTLKMSFREQGAYLYFPCPSCQKEAALKAYGDKKNLWYCNACKKSGHIISLTRDTRQVEWEEAKSILADCTASTRKTLLPLTFAYELCYNDILDKQGLTKEFCALMEVGKPKGKSMLAGCVAFKVKDEGKSVAYYGLRMKDLKPVFHKSFNPELYLYNSDDIKPEDGVILTTDMFRCLRLAQSGLQVVCNFGLPYLSPNQLDFLSKAYAVIFPKEEAQNFEIIRTLVEHCDKVHIHKVE